MLVAEADADVLEPHRLQHLVELGGGVLLGRSDVGWSEAAGEHLAAGFVGEGLAVGLRPLSCLVERTCAGFVEEMVVEKFDVGQQHANGVAVGTNPAFFSIGEVDAESEGSRVDAHEFIVAEESVAHGVDEFFIADREEFPLADGFDALYLCGRELDVFLRGERGAVAAEHPVDEGEGCDEHDGNDADDDDGCAGESAQENAQDVENALFLLLVMLCCILLRHSVEGGLRGCVLSG